MTVLTLLLMSVNVVAAIDEEDKDEKCDDENYEVMMKCVVIILWHLP